MNMFDEARAFLCTMQMRGISQRKMAEMLGVSQSYIANKLRLLKLDEEIQRRITACGLSERHARALLRLEKTEDRLTALDKICSDGLSVARTEALVDFIRTAEVPERIGRSQQLSGIGIFTDGIKESVNALSAIGVDAKSSMSYYENKLYITVCITDN